MSTDKPTQEELQAKTDAAAAELEKAIKDGSFSELDEEEGSDEKDQKQSEGEQGVHDQDDDTKGEADSEKDKEAEASGSDNADENGKTSDVNSDFKKKYSESSRQNQKTTAAKRVVDQAIVEASKLENVTEDDLKAEYPEWEDMTDTEKKLAKSALISTKRFQMINTASEKAEKIEKWNDDVTKYVDDPKTLVDNPDLEGKEILFKNFATQDEMRNVPMPVLVSAFLHEQSKSKPAKKKGQMMETGTGGSDSKGDNKPAKLSLADAEKLKNTNYSEYVRAVKAKRIDYNPS